MGDPLTRVPEFVQGIDVRTLPLSSLEGFVLSRIDGRAPVREIIAMTGLPAEQVLSMLDRLCQLGAARWQGEGGVSATAAQSSSSGAAPPAQPREGSRSGSSGSDRPVRPGSSGDQVPVRDTGASPSARRKSGSHPPVRRAMSESGISQPPPEVRRPGQYASSSSAPPTENRTQPPHQPPAAKLPGDAEPSGAPAQVEPLLYDPRELDEPCDLPRERRKQVLDLFYRLKELDYYEVLDLPYDADKKQVRSAYFGLSKSFHPDSMFRKELGSYKAKMEAVFKYLTEAYETLGKKKSRDEYDAYLRSTKATRMAERALAMAARESVETERVLEASVPLPPPVPGAFAPGAVQGEGKAPKETEVAPLRETSEEARKLAQEVIARRLRGAMAPPPSRPAPSPPAPSPPPVQSPSLREELPRPTSGDRTPSQVLRAQLGRALKDAHAVTSGTPAEQLVRLVEASHAALERGELQKATNLMRRAVSAAPERRDLRAEYEQLSNKLSEQLADEYAVQAQFEAKHGKWAAAAVAWSKVCEGRPQDFNAHRQAALALLKVGGDLRGAQKYAQQATFLSPNDVDARVILAQIYLTLGLKLNAKRELDTALKLDPGSEIVKNLLSDLKG